MIEYICIGICIVVLCLIFWYWWVNRYEGFSPIQDDISQGNPISWSHRPNPFYDVNHRGPRDPVIYQSNGIPLLHEDHTTIPVDHSMFYFEKNSCHPECCLYSAYSCSNGCVCWNVKPPPPVLRNVKISPRS
jgi:hypothetical protein